MMKLASSRNALTSIKSGAVVTQVWPELQEAERFPLPQEEHIFCSLVSKRGAGAGFGNVHSVLQSLLSPQPILNHS